MKFRRRQNLDGERSLRHEILHNIDIWTPLKGEMLYNDTFDTRVRAAIRVGEYKLITGDPGDGTWYPVPSNEEDAKPVKTGDDKKNVWLFNVVKDSHEVLDMSDSLPDKVYKLLE